ncbi:MAG: oligoribonuclease [Candidatus Ancillula sp.]|jgi:oligoribonuclease|nr:oligoribonuclease [Candidatus Ancillula sp.]
MNEKTSEPAQVLIWVDCEMTGLDIDNDELIEIAVIPTNLDLEFLDNKNEDHGIDIVINPTQKGYERIQKNSLVKKMHENSGLTKILYTEKAESLEKAEKEVLNYIKKFSPKPFKSLLSGNSVHVDKKFIDKYMPQVSKHLHYRIIDVSTIKELAKKWYPEVIALQKEKASNHRALDDIIESIEEMRYYKENCFI